jgi:ComF family protein
VRWSRKAAMQARWAALPGALGAVALDAVFPVRCSGCGRFFRRRRIAGSRIPEYPDPEKELRTILSDFLCDACGLLVEWIHSPFCTCCGRPFDAPQGVDHRCGKCRENPFDFTMARSAGTYRGAFKALICGYKYQFRVDLAVPLSRILWRILHLHWDPQTIDCIIPVPLHRRRLRERGFNQSEFMLRPWLATLRKRGRPPNWPTLSTDNLIRRRCTHPQTGLDRNQRIANLHRAFYLADPEAVRGCRVLLVDDVLTTGATVNACARALQKAQVASVEVLTLARAV